MSFLCCLVARTQDDSTFLLFTAAGDGGGAAGSCSVLEIDKHTGQVLFVGEYEAESAALGALGSSHAFVERRRVYAVLGLLLSFGCALLFVATKLRATSLPGGHKASTVCQVDVIELPMALCNDHLHAREQLHDVLRSTRRYPLEELHFFSATLDLTRPFGPSPAVAVPSAPPAGPAFAWNDFLRDAFVQEGLGLFCPVLLQGYCASRAVPDTDLHVATICRRSSAAPEWEVDWIVWGPDRLSSFTLRRSSAPQTSNKDALSGYFEELAEQMRRAHESPLFDPFVCLFSLKGHEEEIATALSTTMSRTALAGSLAYASFDWAQATKLHSGKLEGAAGEAWNVLGEHLRAMGPAFSLSGDGESVASAQHGALLIVSDDGLKSVSEFLVYFSLVVVAELVRVVTGGRNGNEEEEEETDEEDTCWQGMGLSTAVLCSKVLQPKLAQLVAALSVECSDAVTFLTAHRESLFTSEVSAMLPASLLSSLHRKVGEYIGTLSETDRKTQEANVALLRNSWFSKRICLSRQPIVASARRIQCPFLCFATATHFAVQLEAARPLVVSLLIDGKCMFERMVFPALAWPRAGTLLYSIPQRPWDLYFSERERVSRLEDSLAEFVFEGEAGAAGALWLFGSVGVPMAAATARAELWKRRAMHAMRPETTLMGYLGGDSTTLYSSSTERASESHVIQYLQHARVCDSSSLLALLTLETKRVAIGLTQDERDQALHAAGLDVCALDPRRLLARRDPAVEDMRRAAVPASFLQCASGAACRSQDRLTLSIARNRLCFQCLRKFCSKCMHEAVILEARLSSPSPVCFACFAEVEQERVLLQQLQRSNKYSEAPAESSEEMAFRQLLRLCASVAEGERRQTHFPFVRGVGTATSLGPDWRLNLLFLPPEHVPLDFFWSCSGLVQFDVHLPWAASLEGAALLAPPGGWSEEESEASVVLSEPGSGRAVARGVVAAGALRVELECDASRTCAVLRATVSRAARIARLVLQFRRNVPVVLAVLPAGTPSGESSPAPGSNSSFEIFGKKSSSSSSSGKRPKKAAESATGAAARRVAASLVEEQLRASLPAQRLLEPARRETRGNAAELWLVRQRNATQFAGGLAVRLAREDAPQKLRVLRVLRLRVDEKGDLREAEPLAQFVVPVVAAPCLVWFPLPQRVAASCLVVECLDASGQPPQMWLTSESEK